ncbi:ComEC/Rec2 family competence protein [Eisenibacter elegans]|jgi:competence protein ComEC|uniref:ComEC/Rec2 family competence protein n=1 Tax=Eisenibacter elegans TaxID=997 RepID=UPI0004178EDA|nr:ComEC/Rec2 family competence protein [Eisenibacter elegans]
MQWLPYSYVRLLAALVLGILWQYFFPTPQNIFIVWVIVASFIYGLSPWYVPSHKRHQAQLWLGLLGLSVFMGVGAVRCYQTVARNHPSHFVHQPTDSLRAYVVRITDEVQAKSSYWQTIAEVRALRYPDGWHRCHGKILLRIAYTDSLPEPSSAPLVGDELIIKGIYSPIDEAKNPHSFDYQAYLWHKGIYCQQYVQPQHIGIIARQTLPWWQQASLQIRHYCQIQLHTYLPEAEALGIASALVLGVKTNLDTETSQTYAQAGLMHILAVSGLHLGLVAGLVSLMLKPLRRWRYGVWVYSLLVIMVLWGYAFLTGASASVLRAATMFSLILLGQALTRQTNIYNIIAASAFILLLYNPMLLFSLGFQLSYLAVIGIIYLYPKIYGIFSIPNPYLDKAWQLSAVSISAQLATFPLGLYYFHQFPNYFLLSNLMVLPVVPFILGGGILLLLLSPFPYLAVWLGWLLSQTIVWMGILVRWLTSLPYASTQGIYLNGWELCFLYGMLLGVLLLLAQRRFVYVWLCVGMVTAWSSSRIYYQYQLRSQRLMTVYYLPKNPHLQLLQGQKAQVLLPNKLSAVQSADYQFALGGHHTALGLQVCHFERQKIRPGSLAFELVFWQGQRIALVSGAVSPAFWELCGEAGVSVFILQNNAVRSLKPLADKLPRQAQYVVDASNYTKTTQKLKQDAAELGLQWHDVRSQGAWLWRF